MHWRTVQNRWSPAWLVEPTFSLPAAGGGNATTTDTTTTPAPATFQEPAHAGGVGRTA